MKKAFLWLLIIIAILSVGLNLLADPSLPLLILSIIGVAVMVIILESD